MSKVWRRGHLVGSTAVRCFIALSLIAVGGVGAQAEVKVPAIFGDHMVLQGEKPIPVWGTARPGEHIKVKLGKDHAKTKADAEGKWRVNLKPLASSAQPATLTIAGDNTISFTDVLIGDVWVASGQSNMEFDIKGASTGAAAIRSADEPMIRLFTVPRATAIRPQSDIAASESAAKGKWLVCTPESLSSGFSAVAYFFGRDIQKFTGKPVGLIHSSWGGTPAESWTSLDGLKKDEVLKKFADAHEKRLAGYDAALATLPKAIEDYQKKDIEWNRVSKPENAAAMLRWQSEVKTADASGLSEPPAPHLIPEPQKPDLAGGPGEPTALFNGMIAPLIPYAIKGAIWYQGEQNGARGLEYGVLFPRMIESWREAWGEGDFPFLYVQLPDFHSEWGLLREAQLKTLSLPNTGMVVAIDVGTVKNIHPPYKEVVGDRMALAAEHVAYGKDLVFSGPIYKSMQVEGDRIRVSFNDVGSGLILGKPPISGPDTVAVPESDLVTFTIAGADKQWYPAEARIDGDTVVVSSSEVKSPVAVRYGWDPPSICNLYNKEGLPASPFRTDTW